MSRLNLLNYRRRRSIAGSLITLDAVRDKSVRESTSFFPTSSLDGTVTTVKTLPQLILPALARGNILISREIGVGPDGLAGVLGRAKSRYCKFALGRPLASYNYILSRLRAGEKKFPRMCGGDFRESIVGRRRNFRFPINVRMRVSRQSTAIRRRLRRLPALGFPETISTL